jgi:hypothetical protein
MTTMPTMPTMLESIDGPEVRRLDSAFEAGGFSTDTRQAIWRSVAGILAHGPTGSEGARGTTGLALGYVQSGKTTSITALTAAAADSGYRIVVALLGVTNLLLDQNTARIDKALEISIRTDYRWVIMANPRGRIAATALSDWLARGRVILMPVLKHAGRLRALAEVLHWANISEVPILIIDDEADQASLNTRASDDSESETYSAVRRLRAVAQTHLYVQYTATPYAPLLLEPGNLLSPQFLEVLTPGPGYTGGREFFVDEADRVIRPIPTVDEQAPKGLPVQLPSSLNTALACFVAGSALLLAQDREFAPISMLVHSTYKTDVQERYRFLVDRRIKQWLRAADESGSDRRLLNPILEERDRLVVAGARPLDEAAFLKQLRLVLREATLWLVNSASDVRRVDWNVAPIHILVGGNKLDRGFTVEGLTVTYMNRPASPQIDTLEQRARAFGYRRDLLPYCQFFASPKTLQTLRGVVLTEYDLRAELEDWIENGGTIEGWSKRIGLLLPPGTKPTRDSVLAAMDRFNDLTGGWHSLRRPSFEEPHIASNRALIERIGLPAATLMMFGRLGHRIMRLGSPQELVELILEPWAIAHDSPGWRHRDIIDLVRRLPTTVDVVVSMLEAEGGGPRLRKFDPQLGFVNLFQGEDIGYRPGTGMYPGDRKLFDRDESPDLVELQIHRVRPRDVEGVDEVLTLAGNFGGNLIVRRRSGD